MRVVQIDLSSVNISWSHNTGTEVLGYEVYIRKTDTGNVTSYDVLGATNVNLVLTSLQVDTKYKIWLVAYGEHLPSLPTEPIDIELNGMIPSAANLSLNWTKVCYLCLCMHAC